MKTRGSFEVQAPPDKVFAYFADPRHLVMANHKKPILEQSTGEQSAGSWYVIGLDNLRAKVEYTAFDPPREIAARVVMSGRGSGGMESENRWLITALDDGARSRVDATGKGSGGLLPFGPLVSLVARVRERRIKREIEAG